MRILGRIAFPCLGLILLFSGCATIDGSGSAESRANGDTIVYDNKRGASDTGNDAAERGGGAITIHGR